MKKKILSMAIVVCMLISMMPTMVFTAEEIPYLDENGTEQTCASATELIEHDTIWNEGWYIAKGDVTITDRVQLNGDVHLILADGAKLNVPKGISLYRNPGRFTVYAQSTDEEKMGKLEAIAGRYDAAIGNAFYVGEVTINGGTVTASGSYYGILGNVTINGGTITATGKNYGLGMNTGIEAAEVMTISGGTVTATGDRVGIEGPLSTGESGNAVIFASSISDQSQKDSWNGVIFEETEGKVYGNITPEGSFEIPANYTLNIPDGNTLTIEKDITLTNSGVIELGGKIINNGRIIKISDNGAIEGGGNISGKEIKDTVRNEKYIDENGEEQICAVALSVKADDTVWSNGWYIVQGEITLENRPEVQGEVHLILADGAKLIAPFGIKVQDDDDNAETEASTALQFTLSPQTKAQWEALRRQ